MKKLSVFAAFVFAVFGLMAPLSHAGQDMNHQLLAGNFHSGDKDTYRGDKDSMRQDDMDRGNAYEWDNKSSRSGEGDIGSSIYPTLRGGEGSR